MLNTESIQYRRKLVSSQKNIAKMQASVSVLAIISDPDKCRPQCTYYSSLNNATIPNIQVGKLLP